MLSLWTLPVSTFVCCSFHYVLLAITIVIAKDLYKRIKRVVDSNSVKKMLLAMHVVISMCQVQCSFYNHVE